MREKHFNANSNATAKLILAARYQDQYDYGCSCKKEYYDLNKKLIAVCCCGQRVKSPGQCSGCYGGHHDMRLVNKDGHVIEDKWGNIKY